MVMKNKKYYHVVSEGLNKFGVDEFNKYYEGNFQLGHCRKFVENHAVVKESKKYKQIHKFEQLGPDAHWGEFCLRQARLDENGNEINDGIYHGVEPHFSVKLKHLHYKVYEVNEIYTEIKL
jgi:hypothetical protein